MENRYYGEGDIIESATGYLVKVGEPVFDDKVTADENGEAHILVGGSYAIENDTQYLVTLEVNGESKMYRELWMSGNADTANEVALSDYTFTMDEGSIGGLTEDDVVIARFEPVEVYTTDAFRAAVSKTAPQTGGGSGGGVLVVTDIGGMLDKTWQEIHDALMSGGAVVSYSETDVGSIFESSYDNNANQYIIKAHAPGGAYADYIATAASRHPSVQSGDA